MRLDEQATKLFSSPVARAYLQSAAMDLDGTVGQQLWPGGVAFGMPIQDQIARRMLRLANTPWRIFPGNRVDIGDQFDRSVPPVVECLRVVARLGQRPPILLSSTFRRINQDHVIAECLAKRPRAFGAL